MQNYALSIANEFIGLASQSTQPMTMLRIMKLSYIAHGFMLALLDQDTEGAKLDKVEAWTYGPVFPSIYFSLNSHGNNPITQKVTLMAYDEFGGVHPITPTLEDDFKKKVCATVLSRYSNMTTGKLIDMLHAPGTPWWRTYIPGMNCVIPEEYTKEYYSAVIEKVRENARRSK